MNCGEHQVCPLAERLAVLEAEVRDQMDHTREIQEEMANTHDKLLEIDAKLSGLILSIDGLVQAWSTTRSAVTLAKWIGGILLWLSAIAAGIGAFMTWWSSKQ
ncbi:MAG: hypothetical protein HQM04_10675 [Magnetococcales bacterium]|nr:hypothetical protein [Magnetococcales bacterium]MBF0115488.1 hypothetical protein [Magnetococcales bacterium]